jgi:hypothetical protein
MNDILSFRSAAEFRKCLAANHRQPDGIWLRIFKKDSGEPTVTYAEWPKARPSTNLAGPTE